MVLEPTLGLMVENIEEVGNKDDNMVEDNIFYQLENLGSDNGLVGVKYVGLMIKMDLQLQFDY